MAKFICFEHEVGNVYINPDHVVAVVSLGDQKCGIRTTTSGVDGVVTLNRPALDVVRALEA